MASKRKAATSGQRIDSSCRMKMDIIRGLMRGQERAEDRDLCANWLKFLSRATEHEARARDCLLEQMVRQLRQLGHLSLPFTARYNRRTELRLLLDEEGRRRLRRISPPEVIAPQPSKISLRSRSQSRRSSPFVWRQRVQHLNTLEEQYRREEQELWRNEFLVSSQAKETEIKEVGVQVNFIHRGEREALDRARKQQEIKQRVERERIERRQQDQEHGRQREAKQRQLDRERREEARLVREQRQLEQQFKVKEQRDYERNLWRKKREAIAHKSDEVQEDEGEIREPTEATRERKDAEPVQEARKQLKCQTCDRNLHYATNCLRCAQQAVLRKENVKQKEMAYEELTQYHREKALAERVRLKGQLLEREKAEQRREIEEATRRRHKEHLKANKLRKEKDEPKRGEVKMSKERRGRDAEEMVHIRTEEGEERKRTGTEERDQKRKKDFEIQDTEPQKESERTQKNNLQKKLLEALEKERKLEELDNEDLNEEFFDLREKQLLQKWYGLREKYKVPPRGQSPEQERAWIEEEIISKEDFLREAIEHTNQISKQLQKIQSQQNLSRGKREEFKEKVPENSKMALRRAHEEYLSKVEQIYHDMEPKPAAQPDYDSHDDIRTCLRNLQEGNNLPNNQICGRCQEIQKQNHFERAEGSSLLPRDLRAHAWRTQPDLQQADSVKEKCLMDLNIIEAALQNKYCALKYPTTLNVQYGVDRAPVHEILAKNQPLQASVSNKCSQHKSPSKEASEAEGLPRQDRYRSSEDVYDLESATEHAKQPYTASKNEDEPQLHSGVNIVSYCTQTGRKRYTQNRKKGAIRRKEPSLDLRAFSQLLSGSRPTEFDAKSLTADIRILEQKLSLGKTIALNKHIQKNLMREARRLIDLMLSEEDEVQRNVKPPSPIFQALIDPLLQGMEDVSHQVLEVINRLDGKLQSHLKSVSKWTSKGYGGHKYRQEQPSVTYLQTVQIGRVLGREHNLVSDLFNDFRDLDPKLNMTLKEIDELYRKWKDQRLSLQKKMIISN